MLLPVETPVFAADVHVVPLEVRILPLLPGATTCNAEVPLPNSTLFAVKLVDPVPPFETANVPATVIAPFDAVLGVKPVEPNEIVLTPDVAAFDANSVTTPEPFFAYSFMSAMFSASSPLARLPAEGTAEAVVL